jgi:hypothetical protein
VAGNWQGKSAHRPGTTDELLKGHGALTTKYANNLTQIRTQSARRPETVDGLCPKKDSQNIKKISLFPDKYPYFSLCAVRVFRVAAERRRSVFRGYVPLHAKKLDFLLTIGCRNILFTATNHYNYLGISLTAVTTTGCVSSAEDRECLS